MTGLPKGATGNPWYVYAQLVFPRLGNRVYYSYELELDQMIVSLSTAGDSKWF